MRIINRAGVENILCCLIDNLSRDCQESGRFLAFHVISTRNICRERSRRENILRRKPHSGERSLWQAARSWMAGCAGSFQLPFRELDRTYRYVKSEHDEFLSLSKDRILKSSQRRSGTSEETLRRVSLRRSFRSFRKRSVLFLQSRYIFVGKKLYVRRIRDVGLINTALQKLVWSARPARLTREARKARKGSAGTSRRGAANGIRNY